MKKLVILFPVVLTFACWLFCSCGSQPEEGDFAQCPAQDVSNVQFCTSLHNSGARGGPPAGIGRRNLLWHKTDLKVRFMGGSQALREKVMLHAKEWEKHCAIKFNFGDHKYADIRVSFSCNGHWSYVGRAARGIAHNKATMNLQLTNRSFRDEIRRVTLHEFGHAIGMGHEHQHPSAKINWNEQKVIDFYSRTQGWSPEKTKRQVINRSPRMANDIDSGFDRMSIMMYPIPSYLTKDGYSTKWNNVLSWRDKAWAAKAYPKS